MVRYTFFQGGTFSFWDPDLNVVLIACTQIIGIDSGGATVVLLLLVLYLLVWSFSGANRTRAVFRSIEDWHGYLVVGLGRTHVQCRKVVSLFE